MKRIIVPASVIFGAALSLSACKSGGVGAGSDAIKLVPDSAEMIGGVNVQSMMKSPLYADNKDKMEAEAKEMMDAAKACNIDPEKLDGILFGADSKQNGVVVIVGDGVGKEDNVKCAIDKIKEKDSSAKIEIKDKDGRKAVEVDGGKAFGYMVNDRTLAFASADWNSKLIERIDGKGTAATEGSLKEVLTMTDTSKSIWFAGNIPSDAAAALGPASSAKRVGGWMDFSAGLALNVTASFGSADDATKVADEAKKQFDDVKGLAGLIGIPGSVVESVKIEASDTKVSVSASATVDDVKAISETVKKMAG